MHEINNPLSYVQTNIKYLKTLLESTEDSTIDVEEFKEAVVDSITGLNQISEITKGMKRHLHSSEQVEFDKVNIIEEINTVLLITRNQYKYNANVKFTYDESKENCVDGHSSKLRQVFMNLIINAAHAIADKHKSRLGTIKILLEEKGGL